MSRSPRIDPTTTRRLGAILLPIGVASFAIATFRIGPAAPCSTNPPGPGHVDCASPAGAFAVGGVLLVILGVALVALTRFLR